MVFCIVGLAIFGILGIFSAKYRRYFRESLHCMRRQLTLKACDTAFDQEMKAKISANASKVSPGLGKFIFKRFALLSWILLAIMLVSSAAVGIGVYNFIAYGNCNGPNSNDFCFLGVLNGNQDVSKLKPINASDAPVLGNPSSPVKIIEVGCFACPYTRDAESIRIQLLAKYGSNVSFAFKDIPLPGHNLSWDMAEAAKCALDQGSYWAYHDLLFKYQDDMSISKMKELAAVAGMNQDAFNACLDSHKYKDAVQKDYEDGIAAGIFATPTYYIDGKPVVGLKAFAQLENIVIGEIKGSCPV